MRLGNNYILFIYFIFLFISFLSVPKSLEQWSFTLSQCYVNCYDKKNQKGECYVNRKKWISCTFIFHPLAIQLIFFMWNFQQYPFATSSLIYVCMFVCFLFFFHLSFILFNVGIYIFMHHLWIPWYFFLFCHKDKKLKNAFFSVGTDMHLFLFFFSKCQKKKDIEKSFFNRKTFFSSNLLFYNQASQTKILNIHPQVIT